MPSAATIHSIHWNKTAICIEQTKLEITPLEIKHAFCMTRVDTVGTCLKHGQRLLVVSGILVTLYAGSKKMQGVVYNLQNTFLERQSI